MARSRLSFSKQTIFEEPTVNLTPLIDVVFVILIMFIVVTPLLELDQIKLASSSLTPSISAQVQESSPITIHVYEDNTLAFNSQRVTLPQLKLELKQAKVKYPRASPQIFHDRQAHFGTYQEVKNAVEEAGFSQLNIILKPAS